MRTETIKCDQCGNPAELLDLREIRIWAGSTLAAFATSRDFCREECLRDWLNKHLPVTTKEEPVRIDPGEGYRLLEVGEDRKIGDEFLNPIIGVWDVVSNAIIESSGKYLVEYHTPHRRRIEPAILSAPDGVGLWEIHDPGFLDWVTVDVGQSSDGFHATSKSTRAPIARWIKGGWTEWQRPRTGHLAGHKQGDGGK